MPNIAITNYCNLHCPYCFAQQMFQEKTIRNISIKQFDKILDWMSSWSEEKHNRIGIIGGEPLLHPEFKILMNHLFTYCYNHSITSLLFTNGLFLNDNIIPYIPNNMSILINYNLLNIEKQQQLNNNLDLINDLGWFAHDKVSLGLNLCQEINDYTFFKDIVIKYPQPKFRMAVAFPGANINMHDYYLKMKDRFLDMVDFAILNNLFINMDCRIPLLYFNEEEKNKIFQVCDETEYKRDCLHPQHEIMADFTMTTCFANYKTINCNQYNSFLDYWNQEIEKK